MNKYNILIVGIKGYYGHFMEFIINLKKKNPYVDITFITSPIPVEVNKKLSGYVNRILIHKKCNSKVFPQFILRRMNALLCYWEFLWLYLKECHYDIIDIHYADWHMKNVMSLLKRMTKNIVISPWGSDVLRVEDEKSINDMRIIYSHARYVTMDKDTQLGKCVIKKFNVNPDKMVKLEWGGEFFDYIQKHSTTMTTQKAKVRFGLEGRYVITCGYNTQKAQRHDYIIDAINSIKNQLPPNLTLLFPFTYGRITTQREEYTKSIINKCKSLGFDIVVVEDHLDMDDLLMLRMATDIFVHVQTTDAGSRCVMEYVSCNKKVVHGAWIKYSYMEDYKPSCYFPVDKLENLGTCIVKAYHSQLEELPQEVKTLIQERGWNYKMNLWNEFFESLVSLSNNCQLTEKN